MVSLSAMSFNWDFFGIAYCLMRSWGIHPFRVYWLAKLIENEEKKWSR